MNPQQLPSRTIPALGRTVSALGLGCWAIGGPTFRGDEPLGYGRCDDRESLRALRRALDLGVTLFDTADLYGCGHSERLLGEAIATVGEEITVVSKFGYRIDESSRQVSGRLDLPGELATALDGSLRRLRRDRVDIYLLHLRDFPVERIDDLIAGLEHEVDRGRILGYGWSTDDLERARSIARGPHAAAIEMAMNVLQGNRDLLEFANRNGLAALLRSPLAMGRLTNRARAHSDAKDDIRSRFDDRDPRIRAIDSKLEAIRAILEGKGRTMAQGALSMLLSRSSSALPIPGFRNTDQVEENVATLRLPTLAASELNALDSLVADLDLPPDPLALRT